MSKIGSLNSLIRRNNATIAKLQKRREHENEVKRLKSTIEKQRKQIAALRK
ncbi:MAG: hypothetical protein IKP81_08690 [Paludibacteraceae bacterium]|nr:hypothetical protein [Paludibacteraceae bacterium]MCR5569859.1 hypothetical protein [Paludibacteraceae bacterium]